MNLTSKNNELSVLFKEYIQKFERKTKELYNNIYCSNDNRYGSKDLEQLKNSYYLFRTWLEKSKETKEKDAYLKVIYQRRYVNDPPSFDETVKNFNYFNYDDWPFFLTHDFLGKMQHLKEDDLPNLYAIMSLLLQGYFAPVKKLNIEAVPTKIPFSIIFIVPFQNQFISCMLGVQKIPNFNNYTGVISYMKYAHSLFFLDISKNKYQLINTAVKSSPDFFSEELITELEDFILLQVKPAPQFVDRIFKYFINNDEAENDEPKIKYETFKFTKQKNLKSFRPNTFNYQYIHKNTQMHYDEQRNMWTLNDHSELQTSESEKYNKFKSLKFAKYFKANSQFKQAVQLVEFLEKIPNFTIKLTLQEKKVIGQQDNVLVLGRSGTGKTTCLMLRLFAMEFLFKLRMKQVKKKFESLFGEIKNEKFGSKDVDDLTGLHSIFVTASPVLCQEVKNYYDKLKNHVKIELMKKEEGEIKKKEEIDNEEVIEDLSFESIEDQNSEREKLKIKLKKYEDPTQKKYDIINENVLKKKENAPKFNRISDIPEDEFPCFFTIKQLIIMIDSDLRYPYLIRN